jgi:hypothetical protein
MSIRVGPAPIDGEEDEEVVEDSHWTMRKTKTMAGGRGG